jgi:hypothetical protein
VAVAVEHTIPQHFLPVAMAAAVLVVVMGQLLVVMELRIQAAVVAERVERKVVAQVKSVVTADPVFA